MPIVTNETPNATFELLDLKRSKYKSILVFVYCEYSFGSFLAPKIKMMNFFRLLLAENQILRLNRLVIILARTSSTDITVLGQANLKKSLKFIKKNG